MPKLTLNYDRPGDEDAGLTESPATLIRKLDQMLAELYGLGEGAQPASAALTAYAALTTAANKLLYFTGSDAPATADLTAFARSLLDDADASALMTTIGFSTFFKTLIDDADAAASRTTLGLTPDGIRDSILPAGFVIDRAYAEYTTWATIATAIPLDNTIPQVGEGTQILSAAITPKSTTNRVRARVQLEFATGTAAAGVAALFLNGAANAVRGTYVNTGAGDTAQMTLEYEYVPGSVAAQTLTVRVGPSTGATMYVNGNSSGNALGGVIGATLVLEEIKAA